jgi:GT2 family glycosyltransferase
MSAFAAGHPAEIGVAIVTYQGESVITGCLDSLLASSGARMRIVVVDNASADGTVAAIRAWAGRHAGAVSFAESAVGELPVAQADLTLLHAPFNGGFAYATNHALEVLRADDGLGLFWLLNPDCQVLPDTAARFVAAGRDGAFGLMGGRVVYLARPDLVQTDGGTVSLATGVCVSLNLDRPAAEVAVPPASALDFISGASCVASRRFLDTVGLMREDYFIYYEEVDWAMRRGDLPLRQVPEAVVLHHGGTATGTGSFDRRPSPFSNYFNYRNRIRFLRRFAPHSVPLALAYGTAKAAQLTAKGAGAEAASVLAGLFGRPPPPGVRQAIDAASHAAAFGDSDRASAAHVALTFHGLGTPPGTIAPDERPLWVPLDRFEDIIGQVAASDAPQRTIFTFDDGNHSDLAAAETLARHGLSGRFFILVGRIGQPGYLAPADLRALRDMGMTVGLHGRDHVDWRRIDDARLADETVAARRELAGMLGQPVTEVAIPFGSYDRRVLGWLRRQGFARIMTSDRGTFRPADVIWNRTSIRGDMTPQEIDTVLAGRASAPVRLRRAAARAMKRWVR